MLVNLVKINVLSTGANQLLLGGAVPSFRGVEALIDGATYSYSIQQGANYEFGRGVYSLGGQSLTRAVVGSSRSNTPLVLSANAVVTFTALAEDFAGSIGAAPNESIIIAASDEVTPLTVGANKAVIRCPYPFTLAKVRASLTTPSSAGLVTIDVLVNGFSIFSVQPTIDVAELSSETAATPAAIGAPIITDDAQISIGITTAGTGAAGLKVSLIGHQ
jgi:hypothetical protein